MPKECLDNDGGEISIVGARSKLKNQLKSWDEFLSDRMLKMYALQQQLQKLQENVPKELVLDAEQKDDSES